MRHALLLAALTLIPAVSGAATFGELVDATMSRGSCTDPAESAYEPRVPRACLAAS